MIVISADTAAFTRFFQFMPSLCRLPAMLTVFADCVVQIAFGLSDDAFAVVITVNGMRRDDTPCQEERSHQCHNDSFALDLFKHSPPSVIPGLGCHGGDLEVRTQPQPPAFRLPSYGFSCPGHGGRVTPV